ncbi:uncharacterized protein ACMZJ9_016212 [Mantella aurantiaca]
MEGACRNSSHRDRMPSEDLHWFYAKSKVSICLAITECYSFLDTFRKAAILSEEESLELQADTRSVHRVIYESLCWIEEKDLPLEYFFDNLFQTLFLTIYPKLKPIHNEYKKGNYKRGIQISTDKDQDKMIFAQEKVKICLAITDLFPFIHGLQDLTILTEVESLKLQADGRPVSRVIYECLSLIEKKDLKLSFVFEYIFQQSYQTLYPGLQIILQESTVEQAGPFNGKQHPVFNKSSSLLKFYEENKSDISAAVNESFPFLNGMHDMGLLSKLELLKLQAEKRPTKDVLLDALSWVHKKSDVEAFFIYVFRDFYLSCFPDLKTILLRLNKALIMDKCHPIPDEEEIMMQQTRKCRSKPICYTELSDHDWEFFVDKQEHAGEKSFRQKLEKGRHKKTKLHIPKDGDWDVTKEQKWIRDAANVAVRLEFPKQVFNDEIRVRCGEKKGVFMKEYWTGDSSHDKCIECDNKMFTVIKFEKYGGREAAKNWKKSLRCAGFAIEKLFQFGILKTPHNIKRKI